MNVDVATTLLEAFARQVDRHGDLPAIVGAGTRLSYATLDSAAEALATRLRAAGIGAGRHVALALPPDARRPVAALAVLKANCAYVPIDASLDPARIAELVAHARCAATLVAAGEDMALEPAERAAPGAAAETGAAYLRFTSGSTGAPKAVLHGQLTALRLAEAFAQSVGVEAGDRVSCFNPFWHTLIWGALVSGAALHVFDLRAGPQALADWIDRETITVYSSFPTAFRAFTAGLAPGRRLASVRRISLSGETLTPADVAMARSRFAPDCVLVNSYGASELGHIAACRIAPDTALSDGGVPVGRALPGVELTLLDDELREAAPGEDGQIAVRCAHLAAGYWERPDLTARSYVTDPRRPDGVVYLTGDVGRFDSTGMLHVVGRKDRQLKVRGHRVQPDEIEAVLATHPAVAQAAVAGFAHWSGDTRLAAYVVARDGCRPDPRALRTHLAERLPAYMVPLHVVTLAELPRAASGKIDWRALPAPRAATEAAAGTTPPMATTLERQILEIWEEQLTTRPIGLDDDFFALGGDSIAATEVALHLEALTGLPLPVTLVFEAPTISALAARIAADEPPPPTVVSLNPAGGRAPLFFFHPDARCAFYGGALARRLSPDQPVHVIAPEGSRPGETMPASFEAMGLARAQLVEALQPEGAVALAGFCNGALIAFETAQALRRAGREVDMLVMIDPPSSHVIPSILRSALDAIDRVALRLLRRDAPLARATGHAINVAHRLRELSRESRLTATLLRRLRARAASPAPEGSGPTATARLDFYGALNDVGRTHLPRALDSPLEVLSSDARDHNRYRPRRWRRVAPGVVFGTLPGSHVDCITRGARTLAAILDARLSERGNNRRSAR